MMCLSREEQVLREFTADTLHHDWSAEEIKHPVCSRAARGAVFLYSPSHSHISYPRRETPWLSYLPYCFSTAEGQTTTQSNSPGGHYGWKAFLPFISLLKTTQKLNKKHAWGTLPLFYLVKLILSVSKIQNVTK